MSEELTTYAERYVKLLNIYSNMLEASETLLSRIHTIREELEVVEKYLKAQGVEIKDGSQDPNST